MLLLIYRLEWHETTKNPPSTQKPKRFAKNANAPTLMNFLSGKDAADRLVWFQLTWFYLLSSHLLARRMNQTGDKWVNVPDVGDWFVMEENRVWNSYFVAFSLFLMIINCSDYGSILTNVLTLTAVILIYYFRTLTGAIYFAGIKESE